MTDVADQVPRNADTLRGLQDSLSDLVDQNAHRYEPVRFRRIESLVRRAQQKRQDVAYRLLERAKQLLADYRCDWARVKQQAQHALQDIQNEYPEGQNDLRFGDIKAVLRHSARLQRRSSESSLTEVLAHFARCAESCEDAAEDHSFEGLLRKQEVDALKLFEDEDAVADLDALLPVGELKALKEFRESWAKRSTEKAVLKALDEAPEDAGPLNSHRLVVRSLIAMQDISPEYLGRFVNHIEALLWLEQAGARMLAGDVKPQSGKSKSGQSRRR
ncbi:MAG: DUF2894 domain-containing protein [Ketobacter sp.]|nr:DUF2894 domain-containing protein [Ketobacter sp.]